MPHISKLLTICVCIHINTTYVFVYNYLVIKLVSFSLKFAIRKYHYLM